MKPVGEMLTRFELNHETEWCLSWARSVSNGLVVVRYASEKDSVIQYILG
jgi:hypothetical protein